MTLHRRDLLLGLLGTGVAPWAMAQRTRQTKGIGVNCFDLFYGPLVDERGVRPVKDRLDELADIGIPFVRFAASPFWPKEWRTYPLDRYYKLMETVFVHAERVGVRLIPSVFWNPASVSDLVGETIASWGTPGSRTLSFAKRYTEDIVRRFGASPSVLHWEFGNEFNLNLDLSNVNHWWPKVNVEMGTPPKREPTDVLFTDRYKYLISQFNGWVGSIQSGTQTSSGSDIPRPNAWNLQQGNSKSDTVEEFRKAVCNANPIAGAVASIHLYPDSIKKYFSGNATAAQLFSEARGAAQSCRQRLIVGEFGVKGPGTSKEERALFEMMLAALNEASIELAALWVFDFDRWQPEWSVTSKNSRAWQLKEIASYNANLS